MPQQHHPPADTAAAEPALLPHAPVAGFHGLRVVMLLNQVSPQASSPVAVLATSTPPADEDRAVKAQEGCACTRVCVAWCGGGGGEGKQAMHVQHDSLLGRQAG